MGNKILTAKWTGKKKVVVSHIHEERKWVAEPYKTGTGQNLFVHAKEICTGAHCIIHNPSEHSMRDFPTHWRTDRHLMERICPHGIGHPDPDHLAALPKKDRKWESIHGCDGCCHIGE